MILFHGGLTAVEEPQISCVRGHSSVRGRIFDGRRGGRPAQTTSAGGSGVFPYGTFAFLSEESYDSGGPAMNEVPAVTQDNLRVLLPSKVALTLEEIAKARNTEPADEIAAFYASDVYHNLENESTKYWWFSPAELCDMYLGVTA